MGTLKGRKRNEHSTRVKKVNNKVINTVIYSQKEGLSFLNERNALKTNVSCKDKYSWTGM